MSQPGRHTAWADLGAEKALVSIDVADTVQQSLIQQRRLDRGAAMVKKLAKVRLGDAQRLFAGTGEARWLGILALCPQDMQAHPAETARVNEAQFPSGSESQNAMRMERARHFGVGDDEAPGHPEVHDPLHRVTLRIGREVKDDVLAHAMDTFDGAARQRLRHRGGRRLHRLALARKPDIVNAIAGDPLVDAVGYGLDFGEFGHCSIVPEHGLPLQVLCPAYIDVHEVMLIKISDCSRTFSS